uniref:uncharacterized protein LOC122607771 isoform X2 n=1 Tax=Erigeron canadensis TaxID=72917 RepID=UPI001CB8BA77|nr:uncharacterized protein LOC122607771 isoform X2 [Erigeron canadensis]
MDSLGTSSSNVVNEGDSQQYTPHLGQIPISNFVSIKLSGETNYDLWKKQMMCLLEYHDMVYFIDGTMRNPMHDEWNKWKDTLVKGWIFGTLSEDVLATVLDLHNAYRVWEKLKNNYDNSTRLRAMGAQLYTKRDISIIGKRKSATEYIPLHRAIIRGDWDKAQEFFNNDRAALTAKVNTEGDSPLHLAITTCQNIQFVENLLMEINPASLPSLVSYNQGVSVLHCAAIVGNTKAAKMLVEKNPCLLFVVDELGYLPILRAIHNNHKITVLYLLEACKIYIDLSQIDGYQNPFEGEHGSWILGGLINLGYHDIAYELINEYSDLAIPEDVTDTPLMCIVNQRDLYYSATRYNSYQRFVYSHLPTGNNIVDNADNMISDIENPETYNTKFVTKCKRSYFNTVIQMIYVNIWKAALLHVPHIKRLEEDKLKHNKGMMILERICEEIAKINNVAEIYNHICGAFNIAVLNDTPEAVETIVRFFPQAIYTRNEDQLLSQVVARRRCEMVYNYLEDQVNGSNDLLRIAYDKTDNNILHLAGLLAPIEKLNVVSGAALQMQKEVQWFKKIEKFVVPSSKEKRNQNGDTPIMVFREEHKQLRKEGEEWMKKTSDSYTITAALIITIVFAAAITIPGGNNGNTGKPIFETKASFIIFAVSDAISLFTSTTSLLLFLSILTARYHEDDFLYKLPKRLIFGLVMLFLSVTSMMVAFSATLYIMFGQGKEWILIPIAALACLPIATYVILQLPLLVELISSTYGREIYSKRSDSRNK